MADPLAVSAAIASILGVNVQVLREMVLRRVGRAKEQRRIRRKALGENYLLTTRRLGEVIDFFYPPAELAARGLIPYRVRRFGHEIWTPMVFPAEPVFTRPLVPAKVVCDLAPSTWDNPARVLAAGIVPELEGISLDQVAAILSLKEEVRLWDAATYRLVSVDTSAAGLNLEFDLGTFFTYLLSYGHLLDELTLGLANVGGSVARLVDKRNRLLPARLRLLPDVEAVVAGRPRYGGISVITAFADGDSFIVPVPIRSTEVAGGALLRSSFPQAFHQPLHDHKLEVSLEKSVYREYYEECLGRDDAEKQAFNRWAGIEWYFETEPAMAWFREKRNSEAYSLEMLSLGWNLWNNNYEASFLLVVEDPEYLRRFRSTIQESWEAESVDPVSTGDPDAIIRCFREAAWTEAIVTFDQALSRLAERFPGLVARL